MTKDKEAKTYYINFTLDEKENQALEMLCKKKNRDKRNMVRHVVLRSLARYM